MKKIIDNDTVMSRKAVMMMDLAGGGYCNTYDIFVEDFAVCQMTIEAGKRNEKPRKFYTMTETDRVKSQDKGEWLNEYVTGKKQQQKVFGSLRELLEAIGFTVNRDNIK